MTQDALPSDEVYRLGHYRQESPLVLLGGVGISALVHAVIVAAIVLGTLRSAEVIEAKVEEEIAPFTPVELVRLGEERPPNALPRIANPPPPQVQEDVVPLEKPDPNKVVLEKKDQEPPPKDAEKVKEKRSTRDILAGFHNPDRPVNDDKPEGHKDGVPEGTLSDAAMANLMNTYQAKVMRDILRQWRVPSTISPERARELAGQVAVSVRLSDDGYITSYTMTKVSGETEFDISIERAVKAFMVRFGGQRLTMPDDPQIKQAVVSRGLYLRRWEYTGR